MSKHAESRPIVVGVDGSPNRSKLSAKRPKWHASWMRPSKRSTLGSSPSGTTAAFRARRGRPKRSPREFWTPRSVRRFLMDDLPGSQ